MSLMEPVICTLCGQDCSREGEIYAYELTRGPSPFQFKMVAVAPISAIDGEAVCRPCYLRELCYC